MKRKIYDCLVKWKNSKVHKPLVIRGARQIGKTYIIEHFMNDHYGKQGVDWIKLDFVEHHEYKLYFEKNLDWNQIIRNIQLDFKSFNIRTDKKVAILLDEIQKCDGAYASLKYLNELNIDIIATGSNLGLLKKVKKNTKVKEYSKPVGYVDVEYMHSLDFEEFLWANGYDENRMQQIKDICLSKKRIPNSVFDTLTELTKYYVLVGGMPEIVKTWISTKNLNNVYKEQKNILALYRQNIVDNVENPHDIPRILEVYDALPNQFAHKYKKFKYSLIKPLANSRKYLYPIQWLNEASIISFCKKMKDIAKPLNANTINTSFKVYFNDIGLLTGSFSEDMQKDIFRNFDNKTKGPIFENLLADFLIKSNKYLCYAEKNKQYEIDFVQVINDKISLIDAKAGSSRSQSINKLVNNLIDTVGYKVGNFNYGVNNQIISLPYFAFYFLLTNR